MGGGVYRRGMLSVEGKGGGEEGKMGGVMQEFKMCGRCLVERGMS